LKVDEAVMLELVDFQLRCDLLRNCSWKVMVEVEGAWL